MGNRFLKLMGLFFVLILFVSFQGCSTQPSPSPSPSPSPATTVDTNAPTLLIVAPAAGSTNGLVVAVSGTVTDDVAVKAVYVTGTGLDTNVVTNFTSGSWGSSLTFTTGGAKTITAWAYDTSSNKSALATVNIAVDAGMPSISIASPIDGSITNVSTIGVSGTSSVGGGYTVTNVSVSVNGTSIAASTSDSFANWSVSSASLTEGINTIVAWAYANSGKSNVTTNTVTLDTTDPVVAISSPTNNQEVPSTVSVSGTASDTGTGVAGVYVTADTVTYTNIVTVTSWSSQLTNLQYGTNKIIAWAVDNAGNVGSPVTNTAIVAAIPVISITSPVDGNITNVASIAVNGTSSIQGGYTVTNVSLSLNGSALSIVATSDAFTNWNTNITLGLEGTNTLVAWAYANSGKSNVTTNTVTLDTIAPSNTISSPTNNEIISSPLNVSGTASDTGTGVANVYVTADTLNYTNTVSGTNWSTKLSNLPMGANSIISWAVDNAGNVGNPVTNTVTNVIAVDGVIDDTYGAPLGHGYGDSWAAYITNVYVQSYNGTFYIAVEFNPTNAANNLFVTLDDTNLTSTYSNNTGDDLYDFTTTWGDMAVTNQIGCDLDFVTWGYRSGADLVLSGTNSLTSKLGGGVTVTAASGEVFAQVTTTGTAVYEFSIPYSVIGGGASAGDTIYPYVFYGKDSGNGGIHSVYPGENQDGGANPLVNLTNAGTGYTLQ